MHRRERIHGGNITRQRTRRISEYIKKGFAAAVFARHPDWIDDDVRPPEHKSKDPSEASLGSCTHVYRTGAWGRGSRKRPAFVDFEPGRFRNLYQIAHSELAVEKWDNSTQ